MQYILLPALVGAGLQTPPKTGRQVFTAKPSSRGLLFWSVRDLRVLRELGGLVERFVNCARRRSPGTRERSVYLSSQAELALRAYPAERPVLPSNYVFLSYLGDGLSTIAIHKRLVRYREGPG